MFLCFNIDAIDVVEVDSTPQQQNGVDCGGKDLNEPATRVTVSYLFYFILLLYILKLKYPYIFS